jgi:hypothetical protein
MPPNFETNFSLWASSYSVAFFPRAALRIVIKGLLCFPLNISTAMGNV